MTHWRAVDTGFGRFHIGSDGHAVTRCLLPGAPQPGPAGPLAPEARRILDDAARQLDAWSRGRLQRFDLPLVPDGTPFQRAVWDALTRIPFGATRSYAQVAADVGRPGAARAVGQANHRNPLAPFVPCHRVVAATGLGGYGGGTALKQAMLDMEREAARRA